MSDGAYSNGGLILCTDWFSVKGTVKLMNMLIIRYRLKCTLQNANGLPRIYISRTSMNHLRYIVAPHMLTFSNYKLYGLRQKL